MSRSKWKGPFLKYKMVYKKQFKLVSNVVVSRSSKVVPKFNGLNCSVYNGKNFVKILVSEDMIGHKFGEFSLTRKTFFHKKKKKKKK